MKTKTTVIEKRYKDKNGQVKSLSINYAKVADRLNEFRSTNPRSKISVKFHYDEEGNLTHHAYIWTDKTEFYELLKNGISAKDALESADAEGSSLMVSAKVKGEKGFEKNETIAVGRALAMLGYASSGEIASSEEMEEFEEFKKQQFEQAIAQANEALSKAKSTKELLKVWTGLTNEMRIDKSVQTKKDEMKEKLADE